MFNNYEFQESGGLDYTVPRGNEFTERWSGWAKSCLLFTIIEDKESNEFVGFTSLNMPIAKNRDADFTIGITQSQWGKGYGTEATQWVVDYGFKALNLHRISLSVTATNARAISLYKYVYVGTYAKYNKLNFFPVALRKKAGRRQGSGPMDSGWIRS
jgi:RimJ/RimL family protein N-acetyltransferase